MLNYLNDHVILMNGGTGTLLTEMGLTAGDRSELWNITHPAEVTAVHRAYFDAGSHTVCANSFGIMSGNYDEAQTEEIVRAAMDTARRAAEESCGSQPKWICLNVGPTGKLLAPLGSLSFDEAKAGFARLIALGVKYGADYIYIETMNDFTETRAAAEAARENCDLPIAVSNTFTRHGRLLNGEQPEEVLDMLEDLKIDIVGLNCSLGPKQMLPLLERCLKKTSRPVIFKPNAGLPEWRPGGITAYNVGPEEFAADVKKALDLGARLVGGCCGTTPEYIAAIKEYCK